MKFYWHLRLHIKLICRRFCIIRPLTFEMHPSEMYEMFVYKHTETIEYVKKVACFLRKLQTLRVHNSRILRIKNPKFSGYSFNMKRNVQWDFQICVSYEGPLSYEVFNRDLWLLSSLNSSLNSSKAFS